jgi:hypothetical protein
MAYKRQKAQLQDYEINFLIENEKGGIRNGWRMLIN